MNQYTEKRQVAALLKTTSEIESSTFKVINGMVEFTMDGQRVYVPTAEAFSMLLKKVSVLEQRLMSVDNKVINARRRKE
jgi:hypothetical protein